MSSVESQSRLETTNLVYLLLGDLREALGGGLDAPANRRWTMAVVQQLLSALTEEANWMQSEGYLSGVCEEWPNWSHQVEQLSGAHAELHNQLRLLRDMLDQAGPTAQQLQQIHIELRDWMAEISAHHRHESRLLHMAYNLDVGAAD